jgi:hypothetical protein
MHLAVEQKIVIIVNSFMSGFLAPFSTLVMQWRLKKGLKNLCTVSKHKLMMTYVRADLAQILTLAECAQRDQSLYIVDFRFKKVALDKISYFLSEDCYFRKYLLKL